MSASWHLILMRPVGGSSRLDPQHRALDQSMGAEFLRMHNFCCGHFRRMVFSPALEQVGLLK